LIFFGFYLFLVAFGSKTAYLPTTGTNFKNFNPKHHGKIMGCLVGMYGISAAIITQIYKFFFQKDETSGLQNYFLFLSTYLPILAFIGVASVRLNPEKKKQQQQHKIDTTKTDKFYGDVTSLQLFKIIDFYLIFFSHFILGGVGLTFINSLGSLADSYGVEMFDKTTYITVLSISNFSGRMIVGTSMDFLRPYFSEVGWYMVVCILMLLSLGGLVMTESEIIFLICTIFMGVAYGGLNSTTLVISTLYFGKKNYGSNNGVIGIGVSISGLIMGLIVGNIYDHYANETTHECFGNICFKYAFMLEMGLIVLIFIAGILLTYRSARFRKRKEYENL